MFEKLRSRVLHWLRIPPEPEAPAGDPAKVRVFRASRRLYYLRLLGWAVGQVMALGGVLFWFGILFAAGQDVTRTHLPQGSAAGVLALLWAAKVLGVILYFIQMALTYVAVRLDYELRWYIVTDRSLRIRSGLWTVQEITMSFANIQQVVVSQGPIARLMGIADVRVESAGGGGGSQQLDHGKGASLHTGVFHGVENAAEIRDLILDRLRQFRETGLGDPDEVKQQHVASDPASEVVLAARELLSETRALRKTLH